MLLRKSKQSPAAPPPVIDVRPMVTSTDFGQMMAIERSKPISDGPWTRREFRHFLACINTQATVVTVNMQVVGYAVVMLDPKRIGVLNMIVAEPYRRLALGKRIVDSLKTWMSASGRRVIVADVSEYNLAGQFFLRSQGFRCTHVVKGVYADLYDAYSFEYRAV